jgi:glutathione S-transferase
MAASFNHRQECILSRHSTCILVGQMDSPFVRHIAIALTHHGIEFRILALSVFADFEHLLNINPAGSVPALQLPDGSVIIGAAAICEWIDSHGSQATLATVAAHQVADAQTISASYFLAQKTGELHRLSLMSAQRSDAPDAKPWISRCWVQIQGSLSLLARDVTRLEKDKQLSHAAIALVCCTQFAKQVCSAQHLNVELPTMMEQYIHDHAFTAVFRLCPA